MYGREVPAYETLVEVTREINADVVGRDGDGARAAGQRRPGHARSGTARSGSARPRELAQAARVFAAFGMHPVGFYDLRDAGAERGPGRLDGLPPDRRATSWPATRSGCSPRCSSPTDRRFFDADTQAAAARRSSTSGRCSRPSCSSSPTAPPPRVACRRTTRTSSCARRRPRSRCRRSRSTGLVRPPGARSRRSPPTSAGCPRRTSTTSRRACSTSTRSTARMRARGIEMIDEIQGPPAWEGPDVLLRQTSFRALAEERRVPVSRRRRCAPGRCGCGSGRSSSAGSR